MYIEQLATVDVDQSTEAGRKPSNVFVVPLDDDVCRGETKQAKKNNANHLKMKKKLDNKFKLNKNKNKSKATWSKIKQVKVQSKVKMGPFLT